ncbi:hypothetical protein PoB_007238600 [Plakobranchus ocellatus]|uniref:Uncharacterized protein n=1 Tax=Plakobranchus ocellatus TaxID=259542 RepID=A0AAV4DPR6_9GAST|nr:hypothetical protein PoB_007238600 [Plakobranchus ocellatus]
MNRPMKPATVLSILHKIIAKNGNDRLILLHSARPPQDDLRLSDPQPGQGVSGEAQTRDLKILAELRAGLLSSVPPKPQRINESDKNILCNIS